MIESVEIRLIQSEKFGERYEVIERESNGVPCLTTAGVNYNDWLKVEEVVRRLIGKPTRADMMAEALRDVVGLGDKEVPGSAAARAYYSLIESGYE